MPKYAIERWDPVLPGNANFPLPMISIKPDRAFIQYAKENNYTVLVHISGTGLDYDNKAITGVIDSSGYFPNYRPNFYNAAGLFTVTLIANWLGYPGTNGQIEVQGLVGPDAVEIKPPPPFRAPVPIEWYDKEAAPATISPPATTTIKTTPTVELSKGQIAGLVGVIAIVLAITIGISWRK